MVGKRMNKRQYEGKMNTLQWIMDEHPTKKNYKRDTSKQERIKSERLNPKLCKIAMET